MHVLQRRVTRGGGGGTLIFSYMRKLKSFLGIKILYFNISGQEN